MELTQEQNDQLVKEISETVYFDGIDELEYFYDEEQNILWGTFIDYVDGNQRKEFDFEIDVETGRIKY